MTFFWCVERRLPQRAWFVAVVVVDGVVTVDVVFGVAAGAGVTAVVAMMLQTQMLLMTIWSTVTQVTQLGMPRAW